MRWIRLLLEVLIRMIPNPFMHNIVKRPNIILKSCGVDTERFLKYVWPFYTIMHERANLVMIY